jgi:hypothetical protein
MMPETMERAMYPSSGRCTQGRTGQAKAEPVPSSAIGKSTHTLPCLI